MDAELLCAARLVRVCNKLDSTQLDALLIDIYRRIIRNSVNEAGVYYCQLPKTFVHSCANVVQKRYTH